MKQLQDTDPMPFGRYGPPPKGNSSQMADVPASYFHWLWTEGGKQHDMQCPVADYIHRNLTNLKQEYPNGIWEEGD